MTTWWNQNIESKMNDFKSWIGDFNYPSKIYCRNYIAGKQYKSVIDCGCGLATDFFGFKNDKYKIDYVGLDSCKHLVELNRQYGITMIEAELENGLSIPSNSYDCVYCREVFEHLSHYKTALSEFIRIATKEIIVVFFIKPDEDEEKINYWQEEDLYHNKYNKKQLEEFILNDPKVDRLFWHEIDDPKSISSSEEAIIDKKYILHIILK